MTSSKHRKFTFNCLLRYLTGSYSSDFKARQYIYIIVKVSKLDFNYRDICIFNIVNELMIRELHLAHLFVTRYRRMAENGFAPPPLGNFADISYLVEN